MYIYIYIYTLYPGYDDPLGIQVCSSEFGLFFSIQFNSKTWFKDGDPTYLPWGHPNMWTNTSVHTYIQNNTGSSDKHSQTQLTLSYKNIYINTLLNLYNVYTNMYIHHTLSFMNENEQYIFNNKHVEQERN